MHSRSLIVLAFLSGCAPSYSNGDLTEMQTKYNEKMAREAKDPDTKAFGEGATVCSKTNNVTMEDDGKHPTSPYTACLHRLEEKMTADLRARAKSEQGAERDHSLKFVGCLAMLHDKGMIQPYKSWDDCTASIPVPVEDREAITSAEDYAAAEKDGSPKVWIDFLGKHPGDKRSADIAKKVIASGEANDEALVKVYATALKELPVERRLMLLGPPGLRVRDVKKMSDAKVAPSIMVARIKSAKEPYKSFEGDELESLKKMGIPDEAVTAMIEVSSKLEDKQKADEERKQLRAEIDALKKLVEQKKSEGGGQTVQTKDGPLDVAASCAKRLAAMNLCDQLPFPGSTVCKSTTETEFPCPQ